VARSSGKTQTVLVVDDEEDVLSLVDHNLREAGYHTRLAARADEARKEVARKPSPDLIVLDVMLPDLPGTTLMRELRQDPRTGAIPILLLTARGDEVDRVVGFELGADDYVTKPFSVRELLLRIGALLRRAQGGEPTTAQLAVGDLVLDAGSHSVTASGREVDLTRTEFRLLEHLLRHAGRLCSRDVLLKEVWGYSPEATTRTVDTHVKRLREKLGEARDSIETIRGIGYRARKA
jgi:two-component system phosphate regulon response regulator PhoB